MSGRRRSSVALGFYAASKFAVHVASDNLREELALVNPDGDVVEFLSYEGVLTATDGPANGLADALADVLRPAGLTRSA